MRESLALAAKNTVKDGINTIVKQPITAAIAHANSVTASMLNCSTLINSSFTEVNSIAGDVDLLPCSTTTAITTRGVCSYSTAERAFTYASSKLVAATEPLVLRAGFVDVREIIDAAPFSSDFS